MICVGLPLEREGGVTLAVVVKMGKKCSKQDPESNFSIVEVDNCGHLEKCLTNTKHAL